MSVLHTLRTEVLHGPNGVSLAMLMVYKKDGTMNYYYGHAIQNSHDSHIKQEQAYEIGEALALGRALRSLFEAQSKETVEELAKHLQNKVEGVNHA